MKELSPREIEINEAFRQNRPWINRKLVTSDKWVAGLNAGGIFFSDIEEIPMTMTKSFRNSRLGQLIERVLRKPQETT